jgi:hypothetical protein
MTPRPGTDEDGENITPAEPVGRIAWFENPGSGGGDWKRHDVSRRARGRFGAFALLDLDGDGDLDLLGTRGGSGGLDGVFWLEKLHSTAPATVFTPAREKESKSLPLPANKTNISNWDSLGRIEGWATNFEAVLW